MHFLPSYLYMMGLETYHQLSLIESSSYNLVYSKNLTFIGFIHLFKGRYFSRKCYEDICHFYYFHDLYCNQMMNYILITDHYFCSSFLHQNGPHDDGLYCCLFCQKMTCCFDDACYDLHYGFCHFDDMIDFYRDFDDCFCFDGNLFLMILIENYVDFFKNLSSCHHFYMVYLNCRTLNSTLIFCMNSLRF